MVRNMLMAISKMLELKGDEEIIPTVERVKCAKLMLDEIVKGMDQPIPPFNPTRVPMIPTVLSEGVKTPPELKTPEPKSKGPEYLVSVDDDKKLQKIKNLPMDAKVLMDGEEMAHIAAIGKTFSKIKIL